MELLVLRGGGLRDLKLQWWREKKLGDPTQICITPAPHCDGYKWRKYGEKKIQNCFYPRTYYRCTHKDDKGCLATKKIQKEDDEKNYYNSPMFQVIYENKHSCSSTGISNVEYEFHHHDQDEHNSSKLDVDHQNLFSELSSELKIGNDIANGYPMEMNNVQMSPLWIPDYQYESDYYHDMESLLSSFI